MKIEKNELSERLSGKTIKTVELRKFDADKDETGRDFDLLRIEFTDGYAIEISTQDYEEYGSWMVFEGVEGASNDE